MKTVTTQSLEEEGANGVFEMLDVRMIREGEHILKHVYRKETHMDHYPQWPSHHSASQKCSVPLVVFHRCETVITDKEKRKVQKGKIQKNLRVCGYPE